MVVLGCYKVQFKPLSSTHYVSNFSFPQRLPCLHTSLEQFLSQMVLTIAFRGSGFQGFNSNLFTVLAATGVLSPKLAIQIINLVWFKCFVKNLPDQPSLFSTPEIFKPLWTLRLSTRTSPIKTEETNRL